MMLPTHALAGMVLAVAVAAGRPELADAAFLAGLVGGVFPDLDMYAGHRRTLHYPVYFSVLGVAAGAVAALAPTVETVGLAVFLLAAAVHCLADVVGGGLELRPWEATSDRAVYDHYRGRWLAPRRWIGYDGSPTDFAVAAVLAAPLLVTLDGAFRWVVVAGLVVAGVYTAVRRILPALAVVVVDDVLAPALSDRTLSRVPERYRAAAGHSGHATDSNAERATDGRSLAFGEK
ncbi:MAG: metal-dependent hydrolase [Haloferacaceae archaeon]